jgi:hypothetical protein
MDRYGGNVLIPDERTRGECTHCPSNPTVVEYIRYEDACPHRQDVVLLGDPSMMMNLLHTFIPALMPISILFVSSLIAKTEPISISELYAQLVTYENHMTIQARSGGSSANLANRGGHGGIHGHRGGRNGGRGHNGGYFNNNNNNSGGYQHWEDEAQVDMTITIVPPVKCARELATPQIGASITSMKNMFRKRELQLLL